MIQSWRRGHGRVERTFEPKAKSRVWGNHELAWKGKELHRVGSTKPVLSIVPDTTFPSMLEGPPTGWQLNLHAQQD
jgi:hypothetical protein